MRNKLYLLSLLILPSCISEIPVDPPQNSNPLVVSSIINPNHVACIRISYVKPFSDSLSDPPGIRKVSIMENGTLIDNPVGTGPVVWSSTYAKEGAKYELIVTADDQTVVAETTIPNKVLLTRAEYRIIDFVSEEGDRLLVKSITWGDPPDEDNYYELMLLDKFMEPDNWYRYDKIDDPVLLQEGDLDYEPGSFVISDKQFNGDTVTIRLKNPVNSKYGIHVDEFVVLRSISEEYYHFKKSWYRHRYLQNTSINVDMIRDDYNIFPLLFQGDPIPLYSNFSQGFGIFAGYTEDIRKLKYIEK